MKKIALLVAVTLPLLSGCVRTLDELGVKTWITMEEQSYILAAETTTSVKGIFTDREGISAESYRELWWEFSKAAEKRSKYPEKKMAEVKAAPFCDLLEDLRVIEYRIKTRSKGAAVASESYLDITGKSLAQSCGASSGAIPIARTVQTDRTPAGEPELAPETYGLMIDAVRTCERARISLMSYPSGHVFTKNDYNKVMNLVNDCKRFELETSINTK